MARNEAVVYRDEEELAELAAVPIADARDSVRIPERVFSRNPWVIGMLHWRPEARFAQPANPMRNSVASALAVRSQWPVRTSLPSPVNASPFREDLRFGYMVSPERQRTAPRGQELPERVNFEAGESAEQRSPPIGIRPYRRGTSAAFSAHRSLLFERGVASGQGTASLPGAGARPHLTPLKVQDGSSQRKFPRGSQSARVGTVRAAPVALVGSPTR